METQHSQSPELPAKTLGDENTLRPGFLNRRSILLAPIVFSRLGVVEEEVSARRFITDGSDRRGLGGAGPMTFLMIDEDVRAAFVLRSGGALGLEYLPDIGLPI